MFSPRQSGAYDFGGNQTRDQKRNHTIRIFSHMETDVRR